MIERDIRIVVLLQHRPERFTTPQNQSTEASTAPDPLIPGGELATLGMALKLGKQLGGTLTALAVGQETGQWQYLSASLEAGCDRAIALVNARADGSQDPGGWLQDLECLEVARVVSAALKRIGCDLLICAESARGERQGGVGPAIAELQQMVHFTAVVDAQLDLGEAEARADSYSDSGSGSDSDSGTDADSQLEDDIDTEIELDAYSSEEEITDTEVVPYIPEVVARQLLVTHRGNGDLHRFRCPIPAVLCVMACPPQALPTIHPPDPETTEDESAIERMSLDDLGIHAESLGQPISPPADMTDPEVRGHEGATITSAADLVTRLVDDQLLR